MLPANLIDGYWAEVARTLQASACTDPSKVWQGIAKYRDQLVSRGVGEIVYHREPQDAASAICKGGFLD